MCGIAGVLELEQGGKPSREGLQRMADALLHRGPDEGGYYQSGPAGLAHRRLSIIDLASGKQPMESPDGRVCVVFNGEIYNYPELKLELEQKGHRFRTTSDTEVLLAAYLQDGLDAFPKLNGMFACAFWDENHHQLVLARDRFGKKPLFYTRQRERLLFASELKALLAHGGVERSIHLPALHEYLTHSYITGEDTILQGIRRLPGGHVLVVRDGRITTRPYWDFRFRPDEHPPSEEEAVERLGDLLRDAVKRRLMSEVPLGAFLSGGLDSSAIVALMAQLSDQPVKTFTIGFEEATHSEVEDARVVARHCGTDHREMIIRADALEILPKLVWHLDEPFGDSSAIPTYYVCQAARKHVTVVLSGDGGDEVFAGYTRYLEEDRYQKFQSIPGWIRNWALRPLSDAMPFTWKGWNYLYAMSRTRAGGQAAGLGIFPYIQERLYSRELRGLLRGCDPYADTDSILQRAGSLDPVSRHQFLDTLQYLPADILVKVDRMSMANSLEVRSPLLDYRLAEFMGTLPVGYKLRDRVSKYIFRKFCRGILPASVLEKKKQGFAIPKSQWFKGDLRSYAEGILLDRKALQRGFFDERALRRMLDHHASGARDYSDWIWCLIVLEMWIRLFLEDPSRHGDGAASRGEAPLQVSTSALAGARLAVR